MEQVDRDKYAFILNHTVMSPTDFLSHIEGRYKDNVYSLTTNVDIEREIRMEVHLDKWRDVHVALTGVNEENKKGFGAEVKWDANRDPSLKLMLFLSLDKVIVPALTEGQLPERNLTAVVTFTYPGRFITGSWHMAARNHYNYIVDASIDWNPAKVIGLFIATEYDVKPLIQSIKLESRLVTPFENWKKTALDAK